jgi:hypothetical protein
VPARFPLPEPFRAEEALLAVRTTGRPAGGAGSPAAARLDAAAPRLRTRRSPLRLGDTSGLTAFGAVVLVLLLGCVAGAIDLVTGQGLGLVFGIGFVLGCTLAALAVHSEDLRAMAVMPPLLYVALTLLGGVVEPRSETSGFLERQAVELASALVFNAPVLFVGTGLAVVVVGARWLGERG